MAATDPLSSEPFDLRRQVERARTDPQAFGPLYDMYVDRVHAFAFRRLGTRSEAEDVTAETMARALAGLERFRWQNGGFGAWLFRIARNLCADALRAGARTEPLPAGAGRELGQTGPAPEATPEEQVVAAESRAELSVAVFGLPDHQLEVVLLKYTAGLRNTEIAACTGMTPTSVSSLLHRTLQKLRERLGEDRG